MDLYSKTVDIYMQPLPSTVLGGFSRVVRLQELFLIQPKDREAWPVTVKRVGWVQCQESVPGLSSSYPILRIALLHGKFTDIYNE